MRERFEALRDEWRERYLDLAPRERRLVQIAAAVSAVLILWLGIWEPLDASLTGLDRDLRNARRDATEIGALAARHAELKRQVGALEKKAGREGGSLFAQLESITVPVVGRERIISMNPSSRDLDEEFREESVDLRLEGISSQRLLRLLHGIEVRSGGMNIERTSFKRQYKDPALLDATIVVTRLQPR